MGCGLADFEGLVSCGLVPPPATRRQHRRQSRAQKTARSGLKGVRAGPWEGGSPHGVVSGRQRTDGAESG